ncbi:MAG: peptidoglycan DD-metalloendopeptidase family protein [Christensenellaceae bacterium]
MKRKLGKKGWYYALIGASVLVLAAAIVTTVLLLAKDDPFLEKPTDEVQTTEPVIEDPEDPVADLEEEYCMPVASPVVLHTCGFYYNQTLKAYYEHEGIDFQAEAGTSVVAVANGTVKSISTQDVLLGSQIVLTHEDGTESVYTYVDARSDLKEGATVKKGETIGTVAEASGEEYKDGAHLHFEMVREGKKVDPETILPFEEK